MDLERQAFALRHLYVYPRLRLAYTYVPKNACTSLKRTFGRAQGWLGPDSPTAHRMKLSQWLTGLTRYPAAEERIVVVRDPFDRLVSGYLNRFLMRRDPASEHAMRTGLAAALPDGASRADVTFADFVDYLVRTPNRRLNEHWRPQSDFLIGSYTRFLRFEHLAEDAEFLTQRGLGLAQARGHGTSVVRRDLGEGWGRQPARRLRRLRRRQDVLPSAASLYDDELRAKVAERYAEDVALVTTAAERLSS